jgi:hypothetical protein
LQSTPAKTPEVTPRLPFTLIIGRRLTLHAYHCRRDKVNRQSDPSGIDPP